jgi:hypothetical protein
LRLGHEGSSKTQTKKRALHMHAMQAMRRALLTLARPQLASRVKIMPSGRLLQRRSSSTEAQAQEEEEASILPSLDAPIVINRYVEPKMLPVRELNVSESKLRQVHERAHDYMRQRRYDLAEPLLSLLVQLPASSFLGAEGRIRVLRHMSALLSETFRVGEARLYLEAAVKELKELEAMPVPMAMPMLELELKNELARLLSADEAEAGVALAREVYASTVSAVNAQATHPLYAALARTNLASALAQTQSWDEAITHSLASVDELRQLVGVSSSYTRAAAESHLLLLQQAKRPAEQFLSQWKQRDASLTFTSRMSEDDYTSLPRGRPRMYTPNGFFKSAFSQRRELEAFYAEWRQRGLQVDPMFKLALEAQRATPSIERPVQLPELPSEFKVEEYRLNLDDHVAPDTDERDYYVPSDFEKAPSDVKTDFTQAEDDEISLQKLLEDEADADDEDGALNEFKNLRVARRRDLRRGDADDDGDADPDEVDYETGWSTADEEEMIDTAKDEGEGEGEEDDARNSDGLTDEEDYPKDMVARMESPVYEDYDLAEDFASSSSDEENPSDSDIERGFGDMDDDQDYDLDDDDDDDDDDDNEDFDVRDDSDGDLGVGRRHEEDFDDDYYGNRKSDDDSE